MDILQGHKTGFYLDQRVNRTLVEGLTAGREFLNCFCDSGGFGVADAALDAKRTARLIRRLDQAPDHATALAFPEGTYLKGLLCQV